MYSKFIVYTCRKMATKATSKDSFGKESIVDDFMYGSNVATAHVYIRMGKWSSKYTYTLHLGVNLEGESQGSASWQLENLLPFSSKNKLCLVKEWNAKVDRIYPIPLENSEFLNSLLFCPVKENLYISKASWGRCTGSCLSSYCWPPSLASCSCPVRQSPTMYSKSKCG